MKWATILAVIGGFICLADAPAHAQSTRPLNQLTNAELIDGLQGVSNDDYALRTNIIGIGAIGQGQLPKGLLMMHDAPPKPAEAMQELIRRGVSAAPDLCNHLDDSRKTKASFKAPMKVFGGLYYSAEYDWNSRTGKNRATGVVSDGSMDPGIKIKIVGAPKGQDPYTLAVGDLCFDIIGRIVNRDFNPVRYQPSAIVIVNSPVLCPDLCTAVRKEWANITSGELKILLVKDVTQPDRDGRDSSAIEPLARYFPEMLPDVVRERLKLPIYDNSTVEVFAEDVLYKDTDPDSRKKKIEQFIATNGPQYKDGLIARLWEDRKFPIQDRIAIPPAEILKQLIKDPDPDYPPITHSVDPVETSFFIDALKDIASPEIDKMIWDEFNVRSKKDSTQLDSDDYVAVACVKHLAHKGNDVILMSYLRRRLAIVDNSLGGAGFLQQAMNVITENAEPSN